MGSNSICLAVLAFVALTPLCFTTVSGASVAFSVGKSTVQRTSSTGVQVTYDTEFLNVGSAFDLTTNIFTCNQAGVYVFYVHAMTERQNDRFLIGIFRNNVLTVSAHASVKEDLQWASGSNTVLLSLAVGDTVQVKFVDKYGGSHGLYGVANEIYTTFSGYLL